MSTRLYRSAGWDDEQRDADYHALSAAEAAALREKDPSLSPWRVVAVQAVVGMGVALMAWLLSGAAEVAWSALYGAITAVVPGALMARGTTSGLSRLSPGVSAVSVMLWESVKMGASVALLVMAPRVVQSLSWPALLSGLAICISVYWFALLWRGREV